MGGSLVILFNLGLDAGSPLGAVSANRKLAHMEWCSVWEPGLPAAPGTLDEPDQRQMLWGFPFDTVAETFVAAWGDPRVDILHWPDARWVTLLATVSEPPPVTEAAEPDVEDCMVRRPERDVFCLRRTDEDLQALRRAPECPEELACSNQGCV